MAVTVKKDETTSDVQTEQTQNNNITLGNVGQDLGKLGNNQPNYNTTIGQAPKAPMGVHFYETIAPFLQADALSPEGQTYMDTIKEYISKNNDGIKLEILRGTGAYLFHKDGNGVAIILDELFRRSDMSTDFVPTSSQIPKVIDDIRRLNQEFANIETIVIAADDYKQTEQMYIRIKLGCMVDAIDNVYTLNEMATTPAFRVVHNLEYATRVHGAFSVHGTRKEANIGFVFEVPQVIDTLNHNYDPRRDNEIRWTPILAVTAKTNFVAQVNPVLQSQMGNIMYNLNRTNTYYTPIVNIVETSTPTPTSNLIPLFLALSVEELTSKSGRHAWLEPYRSYMKDNPNNLGRLLVNPETKEPVYISNPQDFADFVQTHLSSPILGIAISDGRADLPRLGALAVNAGNRNDEDSLINADLTACVSNFLGIHLGTNVQFTRHEYTYAEITGIMEVAAGEYVSTEYMDYFKAVHLTSGSDIGMASRFLHGTPVKPSEKLNILKDLSYKNIRPLYNTRYCIIHDNVINIFNNEIGNRLNIISADEGFEDIPRQIDYNPAVMGYNGLVNTRITRPYAQNNTYSYGQGPSIWHSNR